MTSAEYQQAFDANGAQGFTLEWVSGYSDGGVAHYAAIWRKVAAPGAWQARHGMTAAQYQDTFNQMVKDGYKLDLVCGYGVGAQPLFAAIWRTVANAPAWEARHAMSAGVYQQTFNQLVGQGYRLQLVSGYSFGGQDQFAAIWTK